MTLLLFSIIFSLMNNSKAQTLCRPVYDSISLELVNPTSSSLKKPVQVHYELVNETLNIHFKVTSPVLHKKDVYDADDYPFQFDVAEIFITTEDTSAKKFSYYEFEVTPLGQVYDLRLDVIDGKRKGVDIEPILTAARFSDKDWSASFSLPLSRIGWNGDPTSLRGNFFTIIGKNPRTYWSAFLPPQNKANFHKPEFFRPLFECK